MWLRSHSPWRSFKELDWILSPPLESSRKLLVAVPLS
jgi:hypothetical protein